MRGWSPPSHKGAFSSNPDNYLKSGYKESGIRKGYYSDGENAIVMIKEEGDEHYEQVYYGDRK